MEPRAWPPRTRRAQAQDKGRASEPAARRAPPPINQRISHEVIYELIYESFYVCSHILNRNRSQLRIINLCFLKNQVGSHLDDAGVNQNTGQIIAMCRNGIQSWGTTQHIFCKQLVSDPSTPLPGARESLGLLHRVTRYRQSSACEDSTSAQTKCLTL